MRWRRHICDAMSVRTYRIEGDAVTIASGDGYRLPTEAEWEYACRAGTATRFSFGDDENALGQYAWNSANSNGQTHPVGGKQPNAFGLYDMHGNVWEWCWDGYDANYYKQSPAVDPHGPGVVAHRVIRGGSLEDGPQFARSALRHGSTPKNRDSNLGFRLALDQSEAAKASIKPADRPKPWPTLRDNPPKPIANSIGMKLVLIPAGEFLMGSPEDDKDADNGERPQHRVRITRPFYSGATEVTQGQYRAVLGENPSGFKGSDDLPVERVSWHEAL